LATSDKNRLPTVANKETAKEIKTPFFWRNFLDLPQLRRTAPTRRLEAKVKKDRKLITELTIYQRFKTFIIGRSRHFSAIQIKCWRCIDFEIVSGGNIFINFILDGI